MMRDCQIDRERSQSRDDGESFQLPLRIHVLKRMRTGSTPTPSSSSKSEEMRALDLTAMPLRQKDPRRPQSSRGGSSNSPSQLKGGSFTQAHSVHNAPSSVSYLTLRRSPLP